MRLESIDIMMTAMTGRRILTMVVLALLAGCDSLPERDDSLPMQLTEEDKADIKECVEDSGAIPANICTEHKASAYVYATIAGREYTLSACSKLDGASCWDVKAELGGDCRKSCAGLLADMWIDEVMAWEVSDSEACGGPCPNDLSAERYRDAVAYEGMVRWLADNGATGLVDVDALLPGANGLCEAHNQVAERYRDELIAISEMCREEAGY